MTLVPLVFLSFLQVDFGLFHPSKLGQKALAEVFVPENSGGEILVWKDLFCRTLPSGKCGVLEGLLPGWLSHGKRCV